MISFVFLPFSKNLPDCRLFPSSAEVYLYAMLVAPYQMSSLQSGSCTAYGSDMEYHCVYKREETGNHILLLLLTLPSLVCFSASTKVKSRFYYTSVVSQVCGDLKKAMLL